MNSGMLRFLALVVAVWLIGGAAPVQGQDSFAHGAVVALQGTPHLWFADEHGVLHWGGDTRALAGKHILWNNRVEVSLDRLRTLPVGDPWLTAGLLKDGDPIYLVKWETDWELPQLLHIQSIKDVELFGINGSNYGNFVIEKNEWERRFGISAAGLQRSVLASAVSAAPQPSVPIPTPSPTTTPVVDYGDWTFVDQVYLINLAQTNVKEAQVSAHTVQGHEGTPPKLVLGCVIDSTPLVGTELRAAIYWGGSYIGAEEHSLRYRFDSSPIRTVKWTASNNGGNSYLPSDSRWHSFMSSLITRSAAGIGEYTNLTVEAERHNGSTITAIWKVLGAVHAHRVLKSACSSQAT